MKEHTSNITIGASQDVITLIVDEDKFVMSNLIYYNSLRSLHIKQTSREKLDFSKIPLPQSLKNIFIIDNQKLTRLILPLDNHSFIDKLHIINNNLNIMPINLGQLNHLNHLIIRQNNITQISGDITKLPLEKVEISSNQLFNIDSSLFKHTSLQQVILHGNKLQHIEYHFPKLKSSLKLINLMNNQLTKFDFNPNSNVIQELNLSLNHLDYFPSCIMQYKSLVKLNLGGNTAISSIPDWLSTSVPNLKELHLTALSNLSCNTLHNIPKTVEVLHLSYCNLEKFPDELFNLPLLKSLYLNGNHIKEIPRTIHQLTALEYIELVNNDLTSLPNELLNLTTLEEINLEYNSFSSSVKDSIISVISKNNIEYSI